MIQFERDEQTRWCHRCNAYTPHRVSTPITITGEQYRDVVRCLSCPDDDDDH